MTVSRDERSVTSNEAALRFRLRACGIAVLPDYAALRRFAAAQPTAFHTAVLAFAGIVGPTARLTGNAAPEGLVLRHADGVRRVVDFATVACLPVELPAILTRSWRAAALAPALAALLLEADLRPDDRLLVAGLRPWPWLGALTQGIKLILAADATPATLRAIAAAEEASVIAAAPAWLATASLDDAPACRPRGVYLDGWADATKTARPAMPGAGTLA